jgi:Protein of unknown function (DUF2937)
MRASFVFGIALLSALLFSQAPEFTQQYFQRLGGVVDELDSIVRHFDEDSCRVRRSPRFWRPPAKFASALG